MGLPKLVTFVLFCLFAMRSEGGLYFRCPLHPCLCESGDMGLVMNCRQRFLTRIPPVIPSDLNFQELSLNKNNIRNLESNAFKGIKVKKVDLSENIITNIAEDAFNGLENILEELVIQVYDMDGLPLNALKNLKALRVLHVIGCKVPVLANDTFSLVPNVEEIRLKTCGIEVVEPSAFRGLEKTLKVLDLFGNDLQAIPAPSLIGLKYVNKMILTGNHVETVEENAFIGMSHLSHLELSSNGIQFIHPMAFHGTQESLVFLGLQRNHLKGPDMEALKILQKLNQLELAYNQIESIPQHLFRKLNRITLIGLQSNKIQRINRLTFAGTEQELKVLLLSDNLVKLIEPNTFRGFQKLRHLYLDRTSAGTGLSRQSFKGLAKSLETLNMQRSGFTASGFLAISELAELKTLVLRDNQITALPPLIFSKLHRLSRLDLQSNRLQSITDPQTFEGLEKSLRQLVLSNNMISTLSACVFEKFEQLRDIVLNQNPLQCDCRIMWLKDWIISKTSMFSRNNLNWICTGPTRHTGKLFREVKYNEMTCSTETSRTKCMEKKERMLTSTHHPSTPLSTTKAARSTGFTKMQNSSTKQINDELTGKSGLSVEPIKHQLLLPDMKDPAFQQDLFYNDIIQRTVQLMASKLEDPDQERPLIQRRRHRFKQPLNKMVTSHGRRRTLARWLSSTKRMYTNPAWVSRRPTTAGKSSTRDETGRHSTRNANQRRKSTRIPLSSVSPRLHRHFVKQAFSASEQPSVTRYTTKRRPTTMPDNRVFTTKRRPTTMPDNRVFTTKRRPTKMPDNRVFTTIQHLIKLPPQVKMVPKKADSMLNLTSAAASGRIKSTSDSSNSNHIRNPFLPPGVRGMWTMKTTPSKRSYAVNITSTVLSTTLAYLNITRTRNSNIFKIKDFEKSTQMFVKPTESHNVINMVTNISHEPNNVTKDDKYLNVTYKSKIQEMQRTSTVSVQTTPMRHSSATRFINQTTSATRPLVSSVPNVISVDKRPMDNLTVESTIMKSDILRSTTPNPNHFNLSRTRAKTITPNSWTTEQTLKMTERTTIVHSAVSNMTSKALETLSQTETKKDKNDPTTYVIQKSAHSKSYMVSTDGSPSTSSNSIPIEFVRPTVSKNSTLYSTKTITGTKSSQNVSLLSVNVTYTRQNVSSALMSTSKSTPTADSTTTSIDKHVIVNTDVDLSDNKTVKPLNASSLIILQTTETIPQITRPKEYHGRLLNPFASGDVEASTTVYAPNNYHQDSNNDYHQNKSQNIVRDKSKKSTELRRTENLSSTVPNSYTNHNRLSNILTVEMSASPKRSKQYTEDITTITSSNTSSNIDHSSNTPIIKNTQILQTISPTYSPSVVTIVPTSSLKLPSTANAENIKKTGNIDDVRLYNKLSKDIEHSSPTEQGISAPQHDFKPTENSTSMTNNLSLGTIENGNESSSMSSDPTSKYENTPTLLINQNKTSIVGVTSSGIAFTKVSVRMTPSTVSNVPHQTKPVSLPQKLKNPYSKPQVKHIDLRNPYAKENVESKYIYTGRPPTIWRNMTAINNWLNSAVADKAEVYQNGSLKSVKLSKPNFHPHHLKEGHIQNPYELLKNFRKMNSRLNLPDAINGSEKNVYIQGKTGQKQHTAVQTTLSVNSTSFGENTSLVNTQKAEEKSSGSFNMTSGPRSQTNAIARNQTKDGTEANADQQGSETEQQSIKPTLLESNIVDIKDQLENNRASGTTNANSSQQLDSKVLENSQQIDAKTTEKLAENYVVSTAALKEKSHTSTHNTAQTTSSHTVEPSNISRSPNTSAQGRIFDDLFAFKNSTQIENFHIPDFAIYVSILPYASNAVKIKWNVSHDETVSGFRVYYGEADNGTLLEGPSLAGNVRTYDITSLLPMERYTFCVVAYLYKTETKKHGQCKELTIEFEEDLKTVSSGQKTKTLALIIGSYGAGALVLVTLLLSIALLVRRYRDKSKTGLYVPRASPYWIEFLCGGFATSRYSNTVLDSSTATVSSGVEMSENDSHSDSDESGTYSFDYSLRSLPAQHIWSTADLHTNLYTY